MTTLVCRVRQRLPVAVVSVFGTIDMTTAARLMVTLRDCVADGPAALIVDLEHAIVGDDRALVPLLSLRAEALEWPGATMSLCAATADAADAVRRVSASSGIDLGPLLGHATVREALDALDGAASPRREFTLDPVPEAPAFGRTLARTVCDEWAIGRVASIAELVVSELVTNAVVHARTPMQLVLARRAGTLSIAVRDGDPRPMYRPAARDPAVEHGRGLLMLDAMADAWGCHPTADGKVVWATINLLDFAGPVH